jgi:hypothetical protein
MIYFCASSYWLGLFGARNRMSCFGRLLWHNVKYATALESDIRRFVSRKRSRSLENHPRSVHDTLRDDQLSI